MYGKVYVKGTRAEDSGGVKIREIAREATRQSAEAKAAQAAAKDAREAREAKEAARVDRLRLLRSVELTIEEQLPALKEEQVENLRRRGRLRVGLVDEVPEEETEAALQDLREQAVIIVRDLEELTVGLDELGQEIRASSSNPVQIF